MFRNIIDQFKSLIIDNLVKKNYIFMTQFLSIEIQKIKTITTNLKNFYLLV